MIQLHAISCASVSLAPEAKVLYGVLKTSCVGWVTSGAIEVVGSGYRLKLPTSTAWHAGGLTKDGKLLVGRTAALRLSPQPQSELIRVPGHVVDVSQDGMRVLWADENGVMYVLDRSSNDSQVALKSGHNAALSPGGDLVAAEMNSSVVVAGRGGIVASYEGRKPSWLDARTLSYLATSSRYRLVDVDTGETRELVANGRPITPLYRSGTSTHLLYATRTLRDRFVGPSCPERYRVIVHQDIKAPGIVVEYGCKGLPAETIRWINNEEICSSSVNR